MSTIAKLRALLAAAAPLPWEDDDSDGCEFDRADAALAVAAVNALPELLDALDAATKPAEDVAEMVTALREIDSGVLVVRAVALDAADLLVAVAAQRDAAVASAAAMREALLNWRVLAHFINWPKPPTRANWSDAIVKTEAALRELAGAELLARLKSTETERAALESRAVNAEVERDGLKAELTARAERFEAERQVLMGERRRETARADRAESAVLALVSAEPLSDWAYDVRDSEMRGWEGPRVQAWGEAVTQAEEIARGLGWDGKWRNRS